MSKADDLAAAARVALGDHRKSCTRCAYKEWNSEKYPNCYQWVFCSTIQPLVDFLDVIGSNDE